MKRFFVYIFLLLAILIEATLTTLPLLLLCVLVLYATRRSMWVIGAALIFGILLDVLLVQTVGKTSLFILSMLLIVMLYQRKFEIATYPFIAVTAFITGFLFMVAFGYSQAILAAIVSVLISLFLFKILLSIKMPQKRYHLQ
ncbi:MAG: hypothetical protein HYT10_02235 [Candidatus Levybacteria bacterium]|nr:hypothetical protein [Candidatus Levybacteria bacterium]